MRSRVEILKNLKYEFNYKREVNKVKSITFLSRPGIYWRICWKFISPCVLLVSIYQKNSDKIDFLIMKNKKLNFTYFC